MTASEIAAEDVQIPPVCITQLTQDECLNIENMAQVCDPPLERAVVKIISTLAQLLSKLEQKSYQIDLLAQIHDTVNGPERDAKSERKHQR